MSSLTALILLAEAAATCAPVGVARLGGGARLVRPVGTFEPLPFERLGPATSVVARPEIVRTGAKDAAEKPQGEQPAEPCAPPIQMV